MQEYVEVMGLVVKSAPMGEYDKRVTILTRERGKIAAFARGARRPGSKLMARTNPFCFGTFKLYEGKSSYTRVDAEISNYFDSFREDLEGAMYGMYFLEVADYYTRENNDEKEMLKLLYQSLRALSIASIPNELVMYIFEIKALVVNGEFPGIRTEWELSTDAVYTIDYVVKSGLDKLYTFVVSKEVLSELSKCVREYRKSFMGHVFHSLDILNATFPLD